MIEKRVAVGGGECFEDLGLEVDGDASCFVVDFFACSGDADAVGAAVNFIGVPFALPYFAAIDQLLKANLSTEASLGVLLAYNLAYVLPFALVPVSVALVGDRSQALLQKINSVMVSLADRLMPAILFLLGLALSADALAFLWRGEALW